MSNIKISEMPSATSVSGSDIIPIVQSGVSKKASINQLNEYSTAEQVIGTWIDGKPLYRKVIEDTAPATNTDNTGVIKNINIASLNVDVIMLNFAFICDSQYSTYTPLPCFAGQTLATRVVITTTDVAIRNYSTVFNNLPIKICISYTKTTD